MCAEQRMSGRPDIAGISLGTTAVTPYRQDAKVPDQLKQSVETANRFLNDHVRGNGALSGKSKAFLSQVAALSGSAKWLKALEGEQVAVREEGKTDPRIVISTSSGQQMTLTPSKGTAYYVELLSSASPNASEVLHLVTRNPDGAASDVRRTLPTGTREECRELLERHIRIAQDYDLPFAQRRDAERAVRALFEKTDWSSINVLQEFHEVIKGIHGKNGYVGSTHIPENLVALAGADSCGEFVRKVVADLSANSTDASLKAHALRPLTTGICWDLAHGKDQSAAELNQDMSELCYSLYRDWTNRSPENAALPQGLYLQYGAWLGDRRALEKAAAIVNEYHLCPSPSYGNFQQACFALESFNSKDPGLMDRRRALLDVIINSPETPAIVKQKLAR